MYKLWQGYVSKFGQAGTNQKIVDSKGGLQNSVVGVKILVSGPSLSF